MTNDNDNEKRTLDLPNDTSLKFFAYGIFKPGQLAYSKIKNHVEEYEENVKINYEMRHRDGVPILIDKENNQHKTEGVIINFKEGHEEQAYSAISKTLLRKLYEWNTVKINGNDINILFGVKPYNGSNYIEEPEKRVKFDGKKDPFFKEAIELIEKNLNSSEFSGDAESFFELQMNYMLLWSAIDRYSSLKYNKRQQNWNRERFAKQKAFKNGINKFKDRYHRPVYSTNDLTMHKFNEEDSEETLNYYYTLRCNIVHRGKSKGYDYKLVETATRELLEIFKDILNDTFYENDLG